MIVVIDASAAVKLVLDEDHSERVRRLWDERLAFVAPAVLLPEVAAAIHRARADGRVSEADAGLAQRSWIIIADEVDLLAVDPDLAAHARTLAATRPVRGVDAIYLSAALQLAEKGPTGLLSYDARQRTALTQADGVAVLPADVPSPTG